MTTRAKTNAFIGIGSNVGDRHAYIEQARLSIAALDQTELIAMSSVHETDPVGPVEQGKFLNAAAQVCTTLSAAELLAGLCAIESEAGRDADDVRVKWGPRTLDLDLLLFGNELISDDNLVVPHPLMHERWFVLKPLAELDAGLVHPLLEMTVGALLDHVESTKQVK